MPDPEASGLARRSGKYGLMNRGFAVFRGVKPQQTEAPQGGDTALVGALPGGRWGNSMGPCHSAERRRECRRGVRLANLFSSLPLTHLLPPFTLKPSEYRISCHWNDICHPLLTITPPTPRCTHWQALWASVSTRFAKHTSGRNAK